MQFFPSTSLFRLKRIMLRWASAIVGENVRICSSVKIFRTSELKIDDNVWIGYETALYGFSKSLWQSKWKQFILMVSNNK